MKCEFQKEYLFLTTHRKERSIQFGNTHTVEIFCFDNLVETHPRLTSAHQEKSTKKYHLKSNEQLMNDNPFYLNRAQKMGPEVHNMVHAILMRGNGFLDLRSIWGILNLDIVYFNSKTSLWCNCLFFHI